LDAPTVIDLFCGAGGLACGLESAGWRTVSAIDCEPDCIASLAETQRRRIPIPRWKGRRFLEGTVLLCGSIETATAAELRPARAGGTWRPDLLAGGPPCQPFSSAGRQLGVADPRGRYFLEFVRLTRELRPRRVLFENVRGLITAKTPDGQPGGVLRLIQESFEDIGYACRFALINAADYGAAQRRIRLVMLAACDAPLPEMPQPTHASREELTQGLLKPWVSLRDFLAKRPDPCEGEVVRPKDSRIQSLMALKPGTGLRAGGIVEANRPGGHWGYRQDSFLADPDLPSRTIRAATTPDWIRLNDGSLRRLTWRECAALQGFPEAWVFAGSVASKFRQIGNAVQVDMARALGDSVARSLQGRRTRLRPSSLPWPHEFTRYIRYTAMEHRVNGAHRQLAKAAQISG
jgi:DNA (cytosine-5)-methyltransferase 1